MLVKRLTMLLVTGILAVVLTTPAMAMDRPDRIWLRDTLIGGGVGLGVGLITDNNAAAWALAGLIFGGIFGYFDAEKGLVEYQREDFYVAGLAGVKVDTWTIEGREKPIPVVKATLLEVGW